MPNKKIYYKKSDKFKIIFLFSALLYTPSILIANNLVFSNKIDENNKNKISNNKQDEILFLYKKLDELNRNKDNIFVEWIIVHNYKLWIDYINNFIPDYSTPSFFTGKNVSTTDVQWNESTWLNYISNQSLPELVLRIKNDINLKNINIPNIEHDLKLLDSFFKEGIVPLEQKYLLTKYINDIFNSANKKILAKVDAGTDEDFIKSELMNLFETNQCNQWTDQGKNLNNYLINERIQSKLTQLSENKSTIMEDKKSDKEALDNKKSDKEALDNKKSNSIRNLIIIPDFMRNILPESYDPNNKGVLPKIPKPDLAYVQFYSLLLQFLEEKDPNFRDVISRYYKDRNERSITEVIRYFHGYCEKYNFSNATPILGNNIVVPELGGHKNIGLSQLLGNNLEQGIANIKNEIHYYKKGLDYYRIRISKFYKQLSDLLKDIKSKSSKDPNYKSAFLKYYNNIKTGVLYDLETGYRYGFIDDILDPVLEEANEYFKKNNITNDYFLTKGHRNAEINSIVGSPLEIFGILGTNIDQAIENLDDIIYQIERDIYQTPSAKSYIFHKNIIKFLEEVKSNKNSPYAYNISTYYDNLTKSSGQNALIDLVAEDVNDYFNKNNIYPIPFPTKKESNEYIATEFKSGSAKLHFMNLLSNNIDRAIENAKAEISAVISNLSGQGFKDLKFNRTFSDFLNYVKEESAKNSKYRSSLLNYYNQVALLDVYANPNAINNIDLSSVRKEVNSYFSKVQAPVPFSFSADHLSLQSPVDDAEFRGLLGINIDQAIRNTGQEILYNKKDISGDRRLNLRIYKLLSGFLHHIKNESKNDSNYKSVLLKYYNEMPTKINKSNLDEVIRAINSFILSNKISNIYIGDINNLNLKVLLGHNIDQAIANVDTEIFYAEKNIKAPQSSIMDFSRQFLSFLNSESQSHPNSELNQYYNSLAGRPDSGDLDISTRKIFDKIKDFFVNNYDLDISDESQAQYIEYLKDSRDKSEKSFLDKIFLAYEDLDSSHIEDIEFVKLILEFLNSDNPRHMAALEKYYSQVYRNPETALDEISDYIRRNLFLSKKTSMPKIRLKKFLGKSLGVARFIVSSILKSSVIKAYDFQKGNKKR